MPCGQYRYGLCRTNRTRGLASRPTIGRLSYLQRQSKPAPTRNYGSENSRASAIRRRVTKVKTPSRDQYGNPVQGAQIEIEESQLMFFSTDKGHFRSVPERYSHTKQRITVQLLGYQPIVLSKYLWLRKTNLGNLVLVPEEIKVPYSKVNIDPQK